MSNKKITIAIDGFSSTGKSTIAKKMAAALGYVYVDTGAMYRAVTLYALENGFIEKNKVKQKELVKNLPNINLNFVFNKNLGYAEIHLNNVNVEKEIRTLKISNHVSEVAAISEVRKKLVLMQQEMGKNKGVVMDGRDIGTVVFPDAELKLYLTASPEIRAKRRYKELINKGEKVTYNEVLENVENRDHIDATREDSPLRMAKGAIEFDNSNMGIEEQFERILNFTKRITEK